MEEQCQNGKQERTRRCQDYHYDYDDFKTNTTTRQRQEQQDLLWKSNDTTKPE